MTGESTVTELINTFISKLRAASSGTEFAVVLIGSVARNAATSQSDLDLLIVADSEIEFQRTAERFHVQSFSERGFLERLRSGDDFVAWCVRFGIPLVNSAAWDRIVNSPEAKTWPEWRIKIDHAARRLLLANDLFLLRDEEAAIEELTYAVSHIGRALLLQRQVFPLSRPEMVLQLADTGYRRLSNILNDLGNRQVSTSDIRQTIRYIKKLLVFLDRDRFKQYLRVRKRAQLLRRRKAADAVATGMFDRP